MDDLIRRRDAMQRFLKEVRQSGKDHIHINTIKRLLDDVDVAYNVDKVIQEIEKFKDMDNREKHCVETKELNKCDDFDDCEQCILEKTISFVRAGGVNG